ncbi:MAG: type I restriction enzyme, S subunit [Methanohalophilus sp. T328-1]|nr:MAG: type I restriction enzyme, S subunit [Methanohalophilus sp. T328-1]
MSSAQVRYMDSSGMDPYPDYKDSGIEWVGMIPEHWDVTKLKYSLSDILGGGTPDTSNSNYWSDINGIPWVSISDITESKGVLKNTTKKISDEGKKSKNLPLIPKGTLLISIFASLGKTTLLDIDATVNQAILGLIPSDFLSRSFLRFFLSDAERYVGYYSSSNTQENLNLTKIKNLDHPIPPLQEQQLITTFLDRETSRIDSLVEKKKQFIELLEERRSALISHAVTKGLDPDVPMKDSGIEWIGEIPEHWDVTKLKHSLSKLESGNRENDSNRLDNGIFSIGGEHISWDGKLKLYPPRYISKQYYDKLNGGKVLDKDILLVKDGATIGKTTFVHNQSSQKFAVNEHVYILRTNKNTLPKYLFYFIMSKIGQEQIQLQKRGAAQPGLNSGFSDIVMLSVPPFQEQQAIANYLDRETSQIDNLIEKTEQSIEYLKEYRTALISSAVTGKIDVRGTVND